MTVKAPKRTLGRVKTRSVGFIRRAGLDALQGPIRSSEGQGEGFLPLLPSLPAARAGSGAEPHGLRGPFSPPLGAYFLVGFLTVFDPSKTEQKGKSEKPRFYAGYRAMTCITCDTVLYHP